MMRLNVFFPSRNFRTTLYIDSYLFKLYDACLHKTPDYQSTIDIIKTIALDTPPYTTPTKFVRSYLEDYIFQEFENQRSHVIHLQGVRGGKTRRPCVVVSVPSCRYWGMGKASARALSPYSDEGA